MKSKYSFIFLILVSFINSNIYAQKKSNEKEEKVKVIKKIEKVSFTQEQLEMLRKKRISELKAKKDAILNKKNKTKTKKRSKAIYQPAPLPNKTGYTGYEVKRGSSAIIEQYLTRKDEIKVKVCVFSGLDILLDSDDNDTISRVILDDTIFFGQNTLSNNKGVHVQLIKPIVQGQGYVETSLRIYRAKDDMPYIINLLGVACPENGLVKYPKVLVLKEKNPNIFPNQMVRPPEDTIIEESFGYTPKYQNKIRVYDMIVDSASDWAVFGVELQLKDKRKSLRGEFKILDSLQIQKLPSKVTELVRSSEKVTNLRGVPTKRFNIKVKLTKEYMKKRRYVHLMFLDHDTKTYQYFRVNTMLWLSKAIERGFKY